MQIHTRTLDAARAQARSGEMSHPRGCAHRASRRGALARRRGTARAATGARALVALLLLVLMPLGALHRSSTGACRYDHGATLGEGAVVVSDPGHRAESSVLAGQSAVVAHQHDHGGPDLPPDGAAPSACGPAVLAERPAPRSVPQSRADLPLWRALSPVALAAPPPAPPPRLS